MGYFHPFSMAIRQITRGSFRKCICARVERINSILYTHHVEGEIPIGMVRNPILTGGSCSQHQMITGPCGATTIHQSWNQTWMKHRVFQFWLHPKCEHIPGFTSSRRINPKVLSGESPWLSRSASFPGLSQKLVNTQETLERVSLDFKLKILTHKSVSTPNNGGFDHSENPSSLAARRHLEDISNQKEFRLRLRHRVVCGGVLSWWRFRKARWMEGSTNLIIE